jgi:hypothetical protein
MPRRSVFDDPIPSPWEGAASTFRDVLEERGQQRVEARTRRVTLREYARLVPEARGPLDFDRFPWQAELYEPAAAEDRELVSMKATQVGVSTWAIRLALYFADVQQRTVLYTFPTDEELRDFSRHRIRPVLRASEHLRGRMSADGVNNVGQKQIGFDGWLYFRGVNGGPVDSVPADIAIFDEYDTSDMANLEGTERRVTGPQSSGLIRRIGVPSIPGFGISELYEKSDQRVWTAKCEACGEWNPIRGYESFEANVDVERLELVCRAHACRRPIDVRRGEWVARYPDRGVRGYHIPKLLIPGRRTLELVVANSRKTKDYQRTAFFTRDLGEPYAPAEGRLSLEQVQACTRQELRPVDPWGAVPFPEHGVVRVMGVDVAEARALNVTIEEVIDGASLTGVKLWAGEIEDDPARGPAFEQLDHLMTAFHVNMCAIDHAPEGRLAQAFAQRFPGRVYRIAFFTPGPSQKTPAQPLNVNDAEMFASLWRTRAYEATFERFRLQRVLLPPLDMLPSDYAAQLGNLYRQKTELANGNLRVEYLKTGPEDYGQAEAYCLAAIDLFLRRQELALMLGQGPVPLMDLVGGPGEDDEDDVDPGEALTGVPGYRSGFE